ncbi:MAG: hypothetical protein K0R38_4139 [Polyangiaceae bacterium]|jgi:hypothetical protein|nr:hypothetical protein [Polyangiaceae bacterium]
MVARSTRSHSACPMRSHWGERSGADGPGKARAGLAQEASCLRPWRLARSRVRHLMPPHYGGAPGGESGVEPRS